MFSCTCMSLDYKGIITINKTAMVKMYKKQWYFIILAIISRVKCGIAKMKKDRSAFKTFHT